MKLRQVDGTQGRRILTWQIVSKEFIEKTPFLKDYHLDGFGSKILYQWCRDFYEKYHDAPGSHIMDIFISQQLTLDDDSKDYIEKLLTSLSGEWEKRREFNLDAAVDTTIQFVNRKEAELLQDPIKQAIENGRVDEVQRLTAEFKPVSKDQTAEIGEDPFNDPQGWEEAFASDQQQVLFELPGVWGEFMGEQLYRESLILAFLRNRHI